MSYSLREINDNSFDQKLESLNAYFTQSSLYKKLQTSRNLTVKTFVVSDSEQADLVYCQIIVAPLFKNKKQIHIPHGPVLLTGKWTEDLLTFLKTELKKIAKDHQAVFVRFDNPDQVFEKVFRRAPLSAYHTALAQPRFEWIMDISTLENLALDNFSKEVRYSLRTATKRGVTTDIISSPLLTHLDDFFKLLKETADRNHFFLHPKTYYTTLFTELDKTNKGFLVIAKFKEEKLVMNLMLSFGNTALHLFGGSANKHKDKLASYKAHLAGMTESCNQGFKYYSFGGISHGPNPDKHWQALTSFKQKFPGKVKDFGPIYDIVIDPIWYYIYNFYKYWRQK